MPSKRILRPGCVYYVAALFVLAASSQERNQQLPPPSRQLWSAACSSKITPPQYPVAALRMEPAGSVSADVPVRDGKGRLTRLVGPAVFTEAVRNAIASTTFPEPCSGIVLNVTFAFRKEGNSVSQPRVSACFSHPPNRFSVIASDMQMVCPHFVYEGALVGPQGLVPITVCELLANPAAFSGRNVALLGRLDDLSEDNCPSNLVTGDHIWPNRVWIADGNVGPDPPRGLLVLDPGELDRKLTQLRRTTQLRLEERTSFGKDGAQTRSVQQPWAVIFGRIEARVQLRPPRGDYPSRDWGNGFGNMNSSPAQIVAKQENEFYISEGTSAK